LLDSNIYIDRADQKSAIRSINEGLDRLPPGAGFFFAEGTRSPDGQIKPFKKGGLPFIKETT
jgi:1-acyl-sn-glycerol-3-phosphate acyltransferase